MTGSETLRDGAKRLYEENDTLGDSPALTAIGVGIKILDKIFGFSKWIPLPSYMGSEKGQEGEPKTDPAMAPKYNIEPARKVTPLSMYQKRRGYETALTRETIPLSIYRTYRKRWECAA